MIFLFLRNLSATIIPSLALPMSIVGTFAVMYLLGYSLDNLSLMALTLSVGFVVDDAIVMLENIVRHMEHGQGRAWRRRCDGSREIGFTILSMTLSLAAVFIPVLFMGGILGRLLHEFAVTIGVAILISGFVSLTLTPMLCSRFLRPPRRTAGTAGSTRPSERVLRRHAAALRADPAAGARATGALMLASPWLILVGHRSTSSSTMPKGFLPSEDTGQIFAITEAAAGHLLRGHGAAPAGRGGRSSRKDPNVDAFMSTVGAGGARVGGQLRACMFA